MVRKMQTIQDDEIDLFRMIQILWVRKWLIIGCTLIGILIGSSYIYTNKPEYESRLIYAVDNIPPFYDERKVLGDFKKKFYSKSNFDIWKKNVGNTLLKFEDFSNTKVVDGFVMAKSEDQQFVIINSNESKDDSAQIIIKTNQLAVLDSFLKYAYFISEYLNKEYVDRAETELEILKMRYKDLSSSNIINTVLSIDRFVVTAKKEANLISIEYPTMPKIISLKPTLVLILSSILSGIIGVFCVLVLKYISYYKKQDAKL